VVQSVALVLVVGVLYAAGVEAADVRTQSATWAISARAADRHRANQRIKPATGSASRTSLHPRSLPACSPPATVS
jgi:hypothetical protein